MFYNLGARLNQHCHVRDILDMNKMSAPSAHLLLVLFFLKDLAMKIILLLSFLFH